MSKSQDWLFWFWLVIGAVVGLAGFVLLATYLELEGQEEKKFYIDLEKTLERHQTSVIFNGEEYYVKWLVKKEKNSSYILSISSWHKSTGELILLTGYTVDIRNIFQIGSKKICGKYREIYGGVYGIWIGLDKKEETIFKPEKNIIISCGYFPACRLLITYKKFNLFTIFNNEEVCSFNNRVVLIKYLVDFVVANQQSFKIMEDIDG